MTTPASASPPRSFTTLMVTLLITGVAVILATLFSGPQLALNILMVAALLLLMVQLSPRLAPGLFSPVRVVVVGLVAVAVLGVVFYSGVERAKGGGGAVVILDEVQTQRTFTLILLCAMCAALGAALVVSWGGAHRQLRMTAGSLHIPAKWAWPLLLACAIPVALLLTDGGLADIWHRAYYIQVAVQDRSFRGLAGQLAVPAVLGLGYLAASQRGGKRMAAVTLALLYLVVFFGLGSRRLAMWPILFALGWYLSRRTRSSLIVLCAAGLSSFGLIAVALYLRSLPSHGIAAYAHYIGGFTDYDMDWGAVARNLLISFGIIGATAFQQDPISLDAFWASLNPMPGASAGWYEVAAELRINDYTPFAAIGELGNQGLFAAGLYFLVVGLIVGAFDRQIRTLLVRGRQFFGLVLVGLSALFLLYAIQYNLRSATRMLIYASLVSLVLALLSSAWKPKQPVAPAEDLLPTEASVGLR